MVRGVDFDGALAEGVSYIRSYLAQEAAHLASKRMELGGLVLRLRDLKCSRLRLDGLGRGLFWRLGLGSHHGLRIEGGALNHAEDLLSGQLLKGLFDGCAFLDDGLH